MVVTEIEWEMTVVFLVAVKDEHMKVSAKLREIARHYEQPPSFDRSLLGVYYLPCGDVLIRVLLAKVPHPSQGGDATAWITTTLAERYIPTF